MTADQTTTAAPSLIAPDATNDERDSLARLRTTLTTAAHERELVDIAWRTVATEVGSLLLSATPKGLVRIDFLLDDDRLEASLTDTAQRVSPRMLEGGPRLDPVLRQLDEYLAGQRQQFEVPVDLQLATAFRRSVLEHLVAIPYGRTESYGDVAQALDKPGASRAVGTACATNPIPLVVPCHRVVRSDGSIGNYAGGSWVKHHLLALEGAQLV